MTQNLTMLERKSFAAPFLQASFNEISLRRQSIFDFVYEEIIFKKHWSIYLCFNSWRVLLRFPYNGCGRIASNIDQGFPCLNFPWMRQPKKKCLYGLLIGFAWQVLFFFSDKEALPISLKNDNSIESQDREIFHIVSARRFLFLVKPGVFHCSFRKGSMLI